MLIITRIRKISPLIWIQILILAVFSIISLIYFHKSRQFFDHAYHEAKSGGSSWIAETIIDNDFSRITSSLSIARSFIESTENITNHEFVRFMEQLITETAFIESLSLLTEDIEKSRFIVFAGPARNKTAYGPKNEMQNLRPPEQLAINELIKKVSVTKRASSISFIITGGNKKSSAERVTHTIMPVVLTKIDAGSEIKTRGFIHATIQVDGIIEAARIHAFQKGLTVSVVEKDIDESSEPKPLSDPIKHNNNEVKPTVIHTYLFTDKKFIFSFFGAEDDLNHDSSLIYVIVGMMIVLFCSLFSISVFKELRHSGKPNSSQRGNTTETLKDRRLIRTIIDSIPQGICWKDTGLNYLGCNLAFAKAVGINNPDLILMHGSSEPDAPNFCGESQLIEHEVISTGRPIFREITQTVTDFGEKKWFAISRIPLISDDGSVSGILCIYDDISSAIQKDAELSFNRTLLEASFEQNPSGMILTTPHDNRIKLVNKAAIRFLGIETESSEKFLQKNYLDDLEYHWKIFDKNGKQIESTKDKPISRTLNGEKLIDEEYRIILQNGNMAWFIVNGTPVIDEKGDFIASLVVFQDITSRKKMEDTLKINEEKYRALFEQASTGVFLFNHDLVIIDCNEQFALTIGAPKEKLIGLRIRELSDQRVIPALENAIEGTKSSYEGDYNTTTSSLCIRVTFTAIPIMNSLDEIAFGCAVVENITEKWLTQKILNEKNEELDNFFTNSLDLLCMTDDDSIIRKINPQWQTTLGYTAEDLIGKSFWSFVHPNDIEKTSDMASILQNDKKSINFINRYRCKDGTYKWIEWKSYHSGNTIYSSARDITARKKAEDEVRMREELFRTLSEMAPIGIFLANEIGEIIITNRKWLEITGLSHDETLGNGWTKFIHPDDEIKIRKIMGASLTSENDEETEFRLIRPDGETKNILIRATPVIKEDGFLSGFVGTIEDITDRKKIETEREHLFFELSQKNNELEGIVYAATHDLRSPLVNIQGFSIRVEKLNKEICQLLEDQAEKDKILQISEVKIPNAINYIRVSAAKMDTLIKGLLQVARIGRRPIVSDTVDMDSMMESILITIAFQIQERSAEISLSSLPACIGDSSQLNQAFTNLIDNALKYTHPDRIPKISIYGYAKDDFNVYVVEDNGSGISEDQLNKIWGMFYRISPSGPVAGEGLGLTMVKRIIERHGGKVWVESDSYGTKFHVSLKAANK